MIQTVDWWFAEQTINKNSCMIGNKQGLDPAHVMKDKDMASVLGVPVKQSYDHLGTLSPIVSCEYLGTQQHVLGYAPSDQVYR
jgi:hypothetical protein